MYLSVQPEFVWSENRTLRHFRRKYKRLLFILSA